MAKRRKKPTGSPGYIPGKIRKEIDRLNAQNVVRSSMPQVVKDVIDGKYTRGTK